MADVLTREQRHKNMQHIRSKDTRAEVVLRKALWHKGIRYRKNYKLLPGKPDIAITKYKIAVFCDSEFFHGKDYYSDYHSKKYHSLEEQLNHSTNPEFWKKKILSNMERDRRIDAELNGMGWIVLHFWSKDILKDTSECVKCVEEAIFERIVE